MAEELAKAIAVSVMFLSMASIFVLRGPLGRALADRLAGRTSRPDPDAGERLEAEVAELRRRVLECEERLDFTERVLSQSRAAGRVGPGGP